MMSWRWALNALVAGEIEEGEKGEGLRESAEGEGIVLW
jgi:hypothetical protein